MATEYLTCSVSEAGPSMNSNETALPVIMICLTDSGGKFSNTWFYAAQDAKTQMLAVALAAISTGSQVNALVDVPTGPDTEPHPQCYILYIIAS